MLGLGQGRSLPGVSRMNLDISSTLIVIKTHQRTVYVYMFLAYLSRLMLNAKMLMFKFFMFMFIAHLSMLD